MFVPVKSVQIL